MEYKKLGDIATYINGYAFKPEQRGSEGLPIIRIQDLTGNAYDLGYYNGDYPKKIELNDGDVLISWSASLGVYLWNRGKALLNQHIFKVVFDKVEIDKFYFMYAVEYNLDKMSLKTHGATMKHITKKDFDNVVIPYPDLDYQKDISYRLTSLKRIIEKYQEQLDLLDELIKARFVEMFGDPVVNDKKWKIRYFSDLGELKRGKSKHRPRNDPILLGGKYPLIQTGDVTNSNTYIKSYTSTYSEEGLKQSKMWKKGTLCITIAANIAESAILTFDACFPDSVVGFTPNGEVISLFIHYWLSFLQPILEENAPAVAQKNLNVATLEKVGVIVPPLELQNQFALFVQEIDKSRSRIQKSLEASQELFDSLMQEYFG